MKPENSQDGDMGKKYVEIPKSGEKSLPETYCTVCTWKWLEDDCFLLGWPIFGCYVSFMEGNHAVDIW